MDECTRGMMGVAEGLSSVGMGHVWLGRSKANMGKDQGREVICMIEGYSMVSSPGKTFLAVACIVANVWNMSMWKSRLLF